MDIHTLLDSVEELAEKYIRENAFAEEVRADEIGEDRRAGYVIVGKDFIAVDSGSQRTLDYYAGFEYVDSDCIFKLGNYTFYTNKDLRVQNCIEFFNENRAVKSQNA